MLKNKFPTLQLTNDRGFSDYLYWSSVAGIENNHWRLSFVDGNAINNTNTLSWAVRAIRAF